MTVEMLGLLLASGVGPSRTPRGVALGGRRGEGGRLPAVRKAFQQLVGESVLGQGGGVHPASREAICQGCEAAKGAIGNLLWRQYKTKQKNKD